MEIAVISEPHLGRARFRKVRNEINLIEDEGYNHWLKSVQTVVDKDPDVLVISGDLFDSPNPSSLSMSYAMQGFNMLQRTNIAVYVIGGNHDFSLKNHSKKSHPFVILQNLYRDFDFQYEDESIVHLKDHVLALLPHQPIKFKENLNVDENSLNKNLANIMKEINRTDKKRVLITHGCLESWAQLYSHKGEIQDATRVSNMVIPESFARNFDLTIIGHNHQYIVEKVTSESRGDIHRLSPGSIMDERNDKNNGPCFIDLSGDQPVFKYIGIDSIKTHKIYAENASDLANKLQNIKQNDIYLISYNGKWEEIPSELYEDAISKALYLNIVESSEKEEEVSKKKMKDFWVWVHDVSPELVDEFKNVLSNRNKKGV